jgi:hypothetical protein
MAGEKDYGSHREEILSGGVSETSWRTSGAYSSL